MFGHDKHKDEDDDVVAPSTQPVNEGLLGVNDDDNTAGDNDDTSSTNDVPTADDSPKADDPTDIGVTSASELENDEPENEDEKSAPASDDLLDIKRQALQSLSPLVGHLDQTPEEKFKTTMMMIQASDDQSLVPIAFEAAKQISDDKERAQALLDIINEINYFTQPKDS